jgi:phage terminase large subunit-like protein
MLFADVGSAVTSYGQASFLSAPLLSPDVSRALNLIQGRERCCAALPLCRRFCRRFVCPPHNCVSELFWRPFQLTEKIVHAPGPCRRGTTSWAISVITGPLSSISSLMAYRRKKSSTFSRRPAFRSCVRQQCKFDKTLTPDAPVCLMHPQSRSTVPSTTTDSPVGTRTSCSSSNFRIRSTGWRGFDFRTNPVILMLLRRRCLAK